MATNSQIITDALRALRIVAEGEAATANQAEDALVALNRMLDSWTLNDIDLQYFAQTDPSAQCPIPKWAERGVVASLAIELAADYGVVATDALLLRAQGGFLGIANRSIRSKARPADMSHLGGLRGKYSVTTDC